jgi:hypothetical protein
MNRRRRTKGMKGILSVVAAAAIGTFVFAAVAEASCIRMSPAEQRARADVIFDGVVLEGPTPTGVQRFRVLRYRKGRGPSVVRVSTGNIRRADGTGMVTSVSVIAKRGERWRIFARGSARKVLDTNVCDGSRPL